MRDHLRQERRQFATQFLSPDMLMKIIGFKGVAKLLRGVIEEDLDLPGIVPSDEKLAQLEAQQGQEGPAPMEASEIEVNQSKAALNNAKAEEALTPRPERKDGDR